jgi:hypothetical protein
MLRVIAEVVQGVEAASACGLRKVNGTRTGTDNNFTINSSMNILRRCHCSCTLA